MIGRIIWDKARRSVSRVLSLSCDRGWPFIWDACRQAPRATDPDGGAEARVAVKPAVPTWSCSRRGLPCRFRCRKRGALLPHPFTLADAFLRRDRRFAFCGTFPRVAPAGSYPAPCFRGARTFLSPSFLKERPSDRLVRRDYALTPEITNILYLRSRTVLVISSAV
jgi:hypothetical protein